MRATSSMSRAAKPMCKMPSGFNSCTSMDCCVAASGFKDLEDGNPIHARRFHGDRRDAGLLEPIGQSMKIPAEGPEGAHRLVVSAGGHGDDMERRPDIEPGRIRVDRGELSLKIVRECPCSLACFTSRAEPRE